MGKVSKITPVTKQNIMKKHQSKATLSATHISFAFAWSRNLFPAAKILISILGLLFQCCCLFCGRIPHPKPPWAPHSCLLLFQLIWTELGWSVTSPNISVLPSFFGAGDMGKGGHKKSLPSCVRAAAFLDAGDAVGRKSPKGMQRCLLGAPGKGWEMEQGHLHTCPCVWHSHTSPPPWDWKFRALQRLEKKKKKS